MDEKKLDYSVGEPDEIESLDFDYYLGLLFRRRVFLLTFFFVITTLAIIFLMKLPNQYKATAQIVIEPTTLAAGQTEELKPTMQPNTYIDTQAEILESSPILTVVAEKENLADFFGSKNLQEAVIEFQKDLKVRPIRGTQLINITMSTSDPNKSASIVNSITEVYVKQSIQNRLYYSKEILKLLPEGVSGESLEGLTPLAQLEKLDKEDFAATLPSVTSNPTVLDLKNQIAKAEAELFELKRQYREQHPEVIRAEANLKFLKESLTAQIKRIVHELKTALSSRLQVSDVRIVQAAEPPLEPSGPKRLRLLALILLLECLVGFGVVILIDYIDDRVKNQDDVEKFVRLPYLGHTPVLGPDAEKENRKKYFYVHTNPQSELAESLRYIRVGINFSAPPEMLRVFSITSSVPQEGKSFCSTNLASSFALDGNRVLLVDGDNRRPVLHTVFNIENKTGLTNFLTSDVSLESVIHHTEIPGLDFVPAGPESPNPAELFGSERMAEFIRRAKASYDRVIVDAPPLMGIGDGLVLGKLIGHLILVIRSHKISRRAIKQVREKLVSHHIKVLGVILNSLDIEQDKYGYYRYHYHTYNRYYGKKEVKRREKRKQEQNH